MTCMGKVTGRKNFSFVWGNILCGVARERGQPEVKNGVQRRRGRQRGDQPIGGGL